MAGAGGATRPALINRGYGRAFFWDARVTTLEEQVLRPIEDPDEMGSSLAEAAARVGVEPAELSRALSSFVRSILSGNSPFDRFINGDREALTVRGTGRPAHLPRQGQLHVLPRRSEFHRRAHAQHRRRLEAARASPMPARGRGDFKTPTLREVEHTAPYMHDGSLATLDDVIEFYDGGGRANPALDPEIRPLRLSAEERRQLVAFLRTVSGAVQFGTR